MITISDPEATNDPETIAVTLTISASPFAPADFDQDGDVDLEDFGHLQACLTGTDQGPPGSGCEDADLDKDAGTDVDGSDVDIFLGCLSGANLSADPNCDH